MDSAFYPPALTRTRVRSHSSKKLETPSDHDNDDINDDNDNGDGQSSEKLDNDHSQPRCVQRKGVRAAGDGGRQNTAASGPARTTKVSMSCHSPTITEPHPRLWNLLLAHP